MTDAADLRPITPDRPGPSDVPVDGKIPAAPDDESDDFATFGAGWAKCTIDGHEYKLRRPFIGELRDLRTALEAVEDEIAVARQKLERNTEQITQAIVATADEPLEKRQTRQEELRLQSRESNHEVLETADSGRLGWWTTVFETLGVSRPPVPPDWPAWMLDPDGPSKLVNHWRDSPLARG